MEQDQALSPKVLQSFNQAGEAPAPTAYQPKSDFDISNPYGR
jgi:hypothetical protein